MPEDLIEEMRQPMKPVPGSFLDQVVQGKDLVCHADLQEAEAGSVGPGAASLMRNGARARAMVALRKDGRLLGTITVYRTEVRPFTDKQIALLQNFAAQAVIAMDNARLITETREALEQQTATAEVLGVINSSPGDLAPVFEAMLDKARGLCGIALASLHLREGVTFRAVAARGVAEALADLLRQPYDAPPGSPPARLLASEPTVHITDIAEEAKQRPEAVRARVAAEYGMRTVLFIPLRKDTDLLGFITAYRQQVQPFSDKQICLLQNFAAQAVIAMENARLFGELRERNEEIAGWNRELEERVATQLAELERTGKLRRFLAPQLAEFIVARGDESILESHRREIVVVFCDVRGFTAFAERAEPEEVMALLRDYHAALGPIVAHFEGTLDHYSGDGVMVFFNDPIPTPEPAKRAIEMAVAMREAAQQVLKTWRRHGHNLGFGVGISQGYATLGQIGFAERMDYTAIGTVTNLAARLCSEAKDRQILISRRVAVAVEGDAKLEEIGEVSLKGLSQPVAVYNVMQ
ncbi:MAG TPA: adenylate/guanylate cyclase domain-containing protein [Candidatus Dormibacteraeota bacterium]|nr:adenylate/guanylate cyclase domain-containing protein [Candidatus Dormibacteraeota bacterium]